MERFCVLNERIRFNLADSDPCSSYILRTLSFIVNSCGTVRGSKEMHDGVRTQIQNIREKVHTFKIFLLRKLTKLG
jgi:hypothetical protein